jgi:hypothetical protein
VHRKFLTVLPEQHYDLESGCWTRRLDVTDRNSNARNATARRTYARPSLTVYGSVRELTGGMSGTGTDAMLMLNMMGA